MNKTMIKLLMVAVLAAVMAMPQETMAKKINYLGHLYKGKVNKDKIPEGQGKIKIKNLEIKGIFNDCTVTNAIVIVDRSVEGPHNCRFDGTIIYDASDNITLKAGGVFTTRYLEGVWYGIENINSGACLYENHKKQYM